MCLWKRAGLEWVFFRGGRRRNQPREKNKAFIFICSTSARDFPAFSSQMQFYPESVRRSSVVPLHTGSPITVMVPLGFDSDQGPGPQSEMWSVLGAPCCLKASVALLFPPLISCSAADIHHFPTSFFFFTFRTTKMPDDCFFLRRSPTFWNKH